MQINTSICRIFRSDMSSSFALRGRSKKCPNMLDEARQAIKDWPNWQRKRAGASRSATRRGLPSASQKSKDQRFELLKEPVSRDNAAETKKRPIGKHTSFGMDRG
jgi:hypothetical protein